MQLALTSRTTFAVMAADIAGYARLVEADEEDTIRRLLELRAEIIAPVVAAHGGSIFKHLGDGFLAVFDDPGRAVRCALELQSEMIERASRFPAERRIVLRIGLNLSETIVEAGDVFGEGVNVAARLQAYAEPGDVVLSARIADAAAGELADAAVFDLGELRLKNISKSVRAKGVHVGSLRHVTAPGPLRVAEERPSIAVLPFRKAQQDATDVYFAEGIVEEIVHALASLKDLFVVSRTSTLRYAGEALDTKAIGHDLGVRYLLYGGVQRQREQLRITTELIDVESAHVLRADRYEGTTAELFQLQETIALAAMRTIAPGVMEQELRRASRKHPESLTAYDLVLQALQYLYRIDYDSHSRTRELLQRAIALDPDYAPAYTYVAYWYIFRIGEGWSTDPEADAAEGARMAEAALKRDRHDPLALAISGHVRAFLMRDFESARVVLDRAIEHGPNCAMAWSMSSITHGYMGQGADAVAHAERGLRLSPIDAHAFWHEGMLAQAYYVAGEYAAAVAWARKAATQNPNAMFNLRVLAASLAAQGRELEARRAAREILKLHPDFSLAVYRPNCPFTGAMLEAWLARLHAAGIPNEARAKNDGR
jgi:class 3 adenylate cyclase/TolB-like protein